MKIADKMSGVVLTGHGDYEKLVYRSDIDRPVVGANEVLIRVGAAAVNNTDINTRIGWYSTSMKDDAGWSGEPVPFPLIQGSDCAGRIVAVGTDVSPSRIGERVLVRTMQQLPPSKFGVEFVAFGSDYNGAFAQYTKTASCEAFSIESDLSDVELASFPCSYSTAENMISRANVKAGEVVLILGASGGVGSAAVQLTKLRGAKVIAISKQEKALQISELGADRVIIRGENLGEKLGEMSIDVVLDMVAGDQFGEYLDILKKGGTYSTVGAIAGPIVSLDVRKLYLKDLSLVGSTYQPREVFDNLIGYIEQGKLKPLISSVFPLKDIVKAQKLFLQKKHVGKIVLTLPED